MDRAAWRATVHGVAKSRTRLSDRTIAASVMTKIDRSMIDKWQIYLESREESQRPKDQLAGCTRWQDLLVAAGGTSVQGVD